MSRSILEIPDYIWDWLCAWEPEDGVFRFPEGRVIKYNGRIAWEPVEEDPYQDEDHFS